MSVNLDAVLVEAIYEWVCLAAVRAEKVCALHTEGEDRPFVLATRARWSNTALLINRQHAACAGQLRAAAHTGRRRRRARRDEDE